MTADHTVFALLPRRLLLLVVCVASMILTGCSAVATHYQATNDNVRALQTVSNTKVSVGQFNAKNEELNHLVIRAGSYESPYNNSFAEYLKAALRTELEAAGKLDANAPVVITGELLTNTLDAAIGTGSAHISARIVVKRGAETVFDKVLHGDNEWESSFMGAVAIPLARQQYADTVKKLLGHLFADKDFQRIL